MVTRMMMPRWWAWTALALAVGLVAGPARAQDLRKEWSRLLEENARTADLDAEADAFYRSRNFDAALPPAQRSVEIWKQSADPNDPRLAIRLNKVALIHYAQGDYAHAEPIFELVLSISNTAPEPNNSAVARQNLARLYRDRGEYSRAEPLLKEALTIRKTASPPDHLETAAALNDLAELHAEMGAYALARPLLQDAVAIHESAAVDIPLELLKCLSNLAWVYHATGDDASAEPLYKKFSEVYAKTPGLGPGSDHPLMGTVLNNQAMQCFARGDDACAESSFQRAQAIMEKRLGPEAREMARVLDNLTTLYWGMGRFPDAARFLTRAQDIEENTLTHFLFAGSEAQNLIYVAQFKGQHSVAVDLALHARDAGSARLALTATLRYKGRALDATAGNVRSLRTHLDPEGQKLLDDLGAANSRLVNLLLRGPGPMQPDAHRRELGVLRGQIEEGQTAISKHSARFRAQQRSITVAAVEAALPDGAALVEWMVYQPIKLRARTGAEKWGPSRYAACVLPKRGAPGCVDLGEVETINREVHTLRAALGRAASRDTPALARRIEARVMAPVRALLGNTRRVFISPDGALNLVPFAALIGDDGRPLIERYAFTYLTSGRDLLRLSAHEPARQAPLILAAPDFDAGATPGAGRFSLLLHADDEANAASRVRPGATVLWHGKATKAALTSAHGPSLLHIATKGYFQPITCSPQPDETALSNPLLQSGIALAGANACASGHDEGLLTAFEASGLDLYGTKLAVLSACETGVGDAKAGDGVYGLRRALVLAGAETQIMTLWPVDGAVTAAMMTAYYDRLARGEGRSEAMRQVQLAMLHTSGREHPYYWAPFIVSGDDRTLDDEPATPDLRVHPGGACACGLGGEAADGRAAWLAIVAALVWMGRRGARLREPSVTNDPASPSGSSPRRSSASACLPRASA